MTDKQIIIDGVDVSGCVWYTQGVTGMICADWHISNDCAKNPNCYYKQLKTKEQECEAYKMEADEGKEINAELKAENKHLNDLLNQALKELEKARETLTEIKEIAEAESYLSPQSTRLLVHKILQKISECEGNDE